MSRGSASRSVARKACGSSSPVGSRTRSQRIGTGSMPLRYHSAVPVAISTRRLVRPYHRLMRQRCQGSLRSVRTALFERLAFLGRSPPTLVLWWRHVEQLGIHAQAGDDADVATNCIEEFYRCERTVGDQDNIASGEPA